LELYRAGTEAQCEAAADAKARYLRGNTRVAQAMREEYHGDPLPTAEQFKSACIDRSRGKTIAADIVFALDIDIDHMFARMHELDMHPSRDSEGNPRRGDADPEAVVEAILSTDERLLKPSDRPTFCFVAALKMAILERDNDGTAVFDRCIDERSLTPDMRNGFECIVKAPRRADVEQCLSPRAGSN
jgi:hypothetical protein